MPKYKNKGEYIMWLASFIERITTGGQPKLPPLSSIVPADFNTKKKLNPYLKVKRQYQKKMPR